LRTASYAEPREIRRMAAASSTVKIGLSEISATKRHPLLSESP
jgi:hypothetical protein